MSPEAVKSPYAAPKLVELGTFEQLTKATFVGKYYDQLIHRGTPVGAPVLS